jgi:serpin B
MRPLSLLASLPFIGCLALSDVAVAADTPIPAAPPAPNAASASNDFNFAMYGALRGSKGNLFFSPTSMRQALGIAYLGARGDTAKEMSAALRLDGDALKSAAIAKAEVSDWQAARGAASLAIANRLWADKSFDMRPEFRKNALDAYGSPVDPVDFSHHPNDARLLINGWVATQTQDKVKDLIPRPAITPDTRVVITNAIWFKGIWAHPFEKAATRNEGFLADGKTSVDVPMMHQTGGFGLASADGAKVLEMRYGKSDLAMDVVLPDSPNGLAAIEDKLATGRFATWTSSLSMQRVDVSFPKLTFTWGDSVKEPLKRLGMKSAFEEGRADLTGIASPRAAGGNLLITDVIHKAFVAIDEQGTEAAAATAVIIGRESATAEEPPPVVFKADHPFVVVIRDVNHGRILFMGRVTNPKA